MLHDRIKNKIKVLGFFERSKKNRSKSIHSDLNLSLGQNSTPLSPIVSQPLKKNEHSRAHGHLGCKCRICLTTKNLVTDRKTRMDDVLNYNPQKYQTSNDHGETDFNFIFSRISPLAEISRNLRINIPETVVFFQGEPKYILLTDKRRQLKHIKQKEKLILSELRKFFQERKKVVEDNEYYNDLSPKKSILNLPSDYEDYMKELNIKFGRNSSTTNQSQYKEFAIVRYNDGSASILTEIELIDFLQKRKVDPIWKEVDFIQAYSKLKNNINSTQKIFFCYDIDNTDQLFKRAANEVHYLHGDIPIASSDYISFEEEENFEFGLRMQNNNNYEMFILMKLYHYFKIFYEIQILKIGADFVKDDDGNVWLTSISELKFVSVANPFKAQNQIVNKDLVIQQMNQKFIIDLQEKYEKLRRLECIDLLNKLLYAIYESIKDRINYFHYTFYHKDISPEAFSKCHPELNFGLDEMGLDKEKIGIMKTHIIKNYKKLYYISKSFMDPRHASFNAEELQKQYGLTVMFKIDFPVRTKASPERPNLPSPKAMTMPTQASPKHIKRLSFNGNNSNLRPITSPKSMTHKRFHSISTTENTKLNTVSSKRGAAYNDSIDTSLSSIKKSFYLTKNYSPRNFLINKGGPINLSPSKSANMTFSKLYSQSQTTNLI